MMRKLSDVKNELRKANASGNIGIPKKLVPHIHRAIKYIRNWHGKADYFDVDHSGGSTTGEIHTDQHPSHETHFNIDHKTGHTTVENFPSRSGHPLEDPPPESPHITGHVSEIHKKLKPRQ